MILVNTATREEPILTPPFCWCNLLLNENGVLPHVYNISFFKVLLFKFMENLWSSSIHFNIVATAGLMGTSNIKISTFKF